MFEIYPTSILLANKKRKRRTKRPRELEGNQYVDSAVQNCNESSATNNGPKQPCTAHVAENEDNFNILINFGILTTIIDGISRCPECNNSVITNIDMSRKQGSSLCIEIKCVNCDWERDFSTSPVVQQSSSQGKNAFEINLRFVMAFREIGKGHEAMKTFCQCLNFPSPLAYSSYKAINEKLLPAYEKAAEVSISNECDKIREEAGGVNALADTTVAIDGTWQRRGYSSLNGAVIATSSNSKVIDYHVMTKYCKFCAAWESKKGSDDYETWKAGHSCSINHNSSAGAMESAGALEIFRRSASKNKLRYINYLGDGDTASFAKVQEAEPYGPNVRINKLECMPQRGIICQGAILRCLKDFNIKSQFYKVRKCLEFTLNFKEQYPKIVFLHSYVY